MDADVGVIVVDDDDDLPCLEIKDADVASVMILLESKEPDADIPELLLLLMLLWPLILLLLLLPLLPVLLLLPCSIQTLSHPWNKFPRWADDSSK